VSVRDDRDRDTLVSRVDVLYAEMVADLYRQRAMVFAQGGRELYDAPVPHD
jgi:hypothetical protein